MSVLFKSNKEDEDGNMIEYMSLRKIEIFSSNFLYCVANDLLNCATIPNIRSKLSRFSETFETKDSYSLPIENFFPIFSLISDMICWSVWLSLIFDLDNTAFGGCVLCNPSRIFFVLFLTTISCSNSKTSAT